MKLVWRGCNRWEHCRYLVQGHIYRSMNLQGSDHNLQWWRPEECHALASSVSARWCLELGQQKLFPADHHPSGYHGPTPQKSLVWKIKKIQMIIFTHTKFVSCSTNSARHLLTFSIYSLSFRQIHSSKVMLMVPLRKVVVHNHTCRICRRSVE